MKTPLVRSDGRTLHVDFENVLDTLIVARNAGVILDHGTRARIVDTFGFDGRRCAHIAVSGPEEGTQLRMVRAWDAPKAVENVVLEFVYRPVLDGPVDLKDWPVMKCFTPGGVPTAFEAKYLDDPVFGADAALEGLASGQPRPVAIKLNANGTASAGRYDVDVIAHGGLVAKVIEDLPQSAWTHFVLHRHEGIVDLYAGPYDEERFVGSYEDILPGGEIYMIALGNAGEPEARGSGYWDSIRLGRPLTRRSKVAPPEDRIRDVGVSIPAPPRCLRLACEKYLFIDDWSIAETRNIRRTFHRPRKHPANPLILADQPWETVGVYLLGGVERRRDGKYRMWYFSNNDDAPSAGRPKNFHTCLALSDDGIHWTKPAVGVCQYEGSRENNIVILESAAYSIILDPEDARRYFRYKAHLRHQGTTGWSSPDGIRWKSHGVILPQSLDASSVHLDPVRKKYVASIKMGYKGRRHRGYAESDDFLHWTDTYLMTDVDEFDLAGDQIYAMQIFRYESLYLAMVKIYHVGTTDTCDTHLAVSHNGMHWGRPYRAVGEPKFATKDKSVLDTSDEHLQPFIPNGPPGAWDFGNNDCAATPPIREGDELRFYYSGRPHTHSSQFPPGVNWTGRRGAIGLATLRLDGFVSADADTSGGWIVTKPLRLEGKNLFVNTDAGTGALRVEILDARGRPIEPFTGANFRTIRSNAVRTKCRWKAVENLSKLAGKTVRLKFSLEASSLYAFWCE